MKIAQSSKEMIRIPATLSSGIALGITVLLLVLVGCTNPPSVPFTFPVNGAIEVPVDTVIKIGFSTAMDGVTAQDPANWSIESNLNGSLTAVGTLGEDARVLFLTPDLPFSEGEAITVTVTDQVRTAAYIPIDEIQIQFTTVGSGADPGDFETGDDEFSIIQLSPSLGTRSVPLRPSVTATFDLPFQISSAPGSVVVQGTRTGFRVPQLAYPGESGGSSDVLQLIIPGNQTELHPGEWMQIVYSSDLLSEVAHGDSEAHFLDPYVARYRAHLGHATGGLGPREELFASGTDAIQFADLGEFLPYSGLEMLLISDAGQMNLLRSGLSGEAASWTVQSQLQLDANPTAAVLVDLDSDSRTEAIVACDDGTLRTVAVVGQELVESGDPVDLSGITIDVLEWAELDGNGIPDLLAGGPDGLRIIRQVTTIDLDTFETITTLAVTGLMPLAAPVESISILDIDRDGRLDVIVSAGDGYLLRGAGNATFLESALLSPAPAGKIATGDVNGDGWPDAVAIAADGLSIHLHPGTLPEGEWNGIPFTTGGLVQDFAVGEVDGDPVGIDDIVVVQSGNLDPLVVIERLSSDLADSNIEALVYDQAPQSARILLVDSDGDRGTDLLLSQQAISNTSSVALWRSSAVVDSGESDLSYSLPASISAGPGQNEIEIPLSTTFEQNISHFTFAIEFDQSLLQLIRIDADEATFPFGSVEVTEHVDQQEGVAAADLVINGYLPASVELPLAKFIFQAQPGVLGDAAYQLADGLIVESVSYSNQAILEQDGALIAADISDAQGVVSITSSTPPPENLVCESVDVSGNEQVLLQWSNPIVYDQADGIQIRKNGVLVATIPGSSSSYSDSDPGSGALSYQVVGVSGGVVSVSVQCDVVLIPAPLIDCERDAATPQSVHLIWGSVVGTNSWELRRDGNIIANLSAVIQTYTDSTDLNAHQYELRSIQQGVGSTPGICAVGDAGGAGTVAPSNVAAALVGNDDVKITWFNGEAYSQINVLADSVVMASLDGSTTEHQIDDQFPGAVVYAVQAFGDGGASNVVSAQEVDIPLSPPSGLACVTDGPEIQLSWENGPQSFEYDEIVVERTGNGFVDFFSLAGFATSYTDVVDQGEWTYRVTGYFFHRGVNHSAAAAPCQISISNRISYEESVAVIGRSFTVDLEAQLLQDVSSWSLQIDYDGNLLQNLLVQVPDVAPSAVQTNDEPLGTFEGLRRLTILVTDTDLLTSSSVLLAQVSGSVDADFTILGPTLFHLVDATLEPSSGGATLTPQLSDGGLSIVGNALFIDGAVLTPGDEVVVWARGVWSQSLTGYTVALNWDPTILTCLEVSNVGTVGEDLSGPFSAFFSGIDASAGTAFGSVISAFETISASLGAELSYFRFLVSPDAPQGLTTSIVFGPHQSSSSTLENVFVDLSATSITPETLDADFVVLSDPQPPTLLSIDPVEGPVGGGTEVLFNGTSFTPSSSVFFGGQPANTVIFIDPGTILATTPAAPQGLVDVSVLTEFGSAELPLAFSYFESVIDSYSPEEANICGPATMLVVGSELPADLGVLFGEIPSVLVEVNPAGTMAMVRVPPSYITGAVDLEFVDAFGSPIATFLDGFTYIDDGTFIRGDVSCDGLVNLVDISVIAAYVAGAGAAPVILDAADIDDDGVVHIGDAVLLANFLFAGGTPPAAPYPEAGTDPTPDGL
ncbi:MAG: IPT/TIG domain-containing protein [Planctomycetota bacterium]|nr:IPT/TIG domain-containing protein [Planctomycetota bacterium]